MKKYCAAVIMILSFNNVQAALLDSFDTVSQNWTVFGNTPAVFEVASFDDDNRLRMGVANKGIGNHWEGKKMTLQSGVNEIAIDLYTPLAWKTLNYRTAIVFQVVNPDTTPTGFIQPAMGLYVSGDGYVKWRIWDTSDWVYYDVTQSLDYNDWHTMKIRYADSTLEYYVDDVKMGPTHTGVNFTSGFDAVALQAYYRGTGYSDVYLDNLTVVGGKSPIPEPATMALLGLGGLALLRKRK